jgi:DNA (cytosine-5)-methyltransferase 1
MASGAEVRKALDQLYVEAEEALEFDDLDQAEADLGSALFEKVRQLGQTNHAARGLALTLFAYKFVDEDQDIRSHMTGHPGGFNARGVDTEATIPFLAEHSLPRSVESHWMTRVFAVAGPLRSGMVIKTVPKLAGPLVAETVDAVNRLTGKAAAAAAVVVLTGMIEQRNLGRVELARPKLLTIEQVAWLLLEHFGRKYEKNAPRLPQVAIYAAYECLVPSVDRYRDCELAPLLRMKAADRKAGTVGDVVVLQGDVPFEAVEVKYGEPIATIHLIEAIAKLETAAVGRYFILSTAGIAKSDSGEIVSLSAQFRKSNGCEIVTNGVIESIRYYLRLLDDPVEFVNRYAALVQEDSDLGYEHRTAWNEICAEL